MKKPEVGKMYYHYKHDSSTDDNNYLYKVIGFALHTETNEDLVIYEPQYESDYKYFARPLSVWNKNVLTENYKGPRFREK